MAEAEPYWLLDADSNNMIGAYESEDDALRDVLDTIERYGKRSVAVRTLALTHSGQRIAEGPVLASRALARFPDARRRSA